MEKHILYISEKLLPFNILQLFSVVASYHRKIFVANIKESHQFVRLLEQIYIRFLSCSIFKCLIYFKLSKNYPHIAFQRPIQRDYRESHGGTKLAFPTQRTKRLRIENVL